MADSTGLVIASDSDDGQGESTSQQVTQVTKDRSTKSGIFDYFSRATTSSSKVNEKPGKPSACASDGKKRKLQKDEHFCTYKNCLKLISRGNTYSKSRHKETHHGTDNDYDAEKYVLPINHRKVVSLLKEKERESSAKKRKVTPGVVSSEGSSDVSVEASIEASTSDKANEAIVETSIREISTPEEEREEEELDSERRSMESSELDENSELVEAGGNGVLNMRRQLDSESSVGSDSEAMEAEYVDDSSVDMIESEMIEIADAKVKQSSSVQETLPFGPVKLSSTKAAREASENNDLHAVHQKLDALLANMTISSEFTNENLPEATEYLDVLNKAANITDINGSGISFYQGKDDSDAIVRCDVCFDAECDNDPSLSCKDPFFLGHTNTASQGGRSLAMGLVITNERKLKYIEGHNQYWHRFKKTLVDHVSCTSSKHGGNQHLQGVIAKKRRDKRNDTILNVICNQLKAALTVVKIKSAALHYEDLIGLLYSCGSNVGNLGHGRNQVNPMIMAFQAYLLKKLNSLLSKPLPSTGIPPHFSTASDKSTPIRITNHAIMVVLMINGKKEAIPIAAPAVYDFQNSEITGGTASHLADQVVSALLKTVKITQKSLSFLMSHQADGQYQARDFIEGLKERIFGAVRLNGVDKFFVVPWDIAHWMDLCMGDMREKEENGEIMRRLIKRINKFHTMFGRGRGFTEYKGCTEEMELSSFSTAAYSTTRFASSAFETFQKVYKNYEGLAKTYERMRETIDEEEETRYLIKGRDFCIDLCGLLDILSPVMEMMVRVQGLNTFLWSITVFWPRIRQKLSDAKKDIEDQVISSNPEFNKSVCPMLNKHFSTLNEESAYDCTFRNVSLTPGWMIVGERDEPGAATNKKTKVYEWVDRSPEDCLNELISFTGKLIENMDERFQSSVTEAAHTLKKCLYIPDIYTHVQGYNSQRLTGAQMALLHEHGKEAFNEFFSYICSLSHIKELSEYDPTLRFLPVLAETVYDTFKVALVEVIFGNLGNCRAVWFPPINAEGTSTVVKHGDSPTGFFIKKSTYEIDDFCEFHYGDTLCTTRFDEIAAFSSMFINEEIYERIGKEMCITVDIALAMSGSEAVVESYYSVMGNQTMPGGQLNDTLVQRTNIDWCFPMVNQCEEIVKEVAALYIDGDKDFGLKAHQIPVFIDKRGRALRKYLHGSKVLDRISNKDEYNFALL